MLKHLPAGYRVVDYRFVDPTAEERYHHAVECGSGAVILWDLFHLGRELGSQISIPSHSRSRYNPEMLEEPLLKYLKRPTMSHDPDTLARAVRKVGRMFYVGSLQPKQLGIMFYDQSKNAGAPTFRKKGEVALEELKRARRIRRGEAPPPVTVFHRGKNDDVARPVFGYPMSITYLEARFFEPYQAEVVRHHNPYMGGKSYPVLGGNVNELKWKSDTIVELDYSGFDGSIDSMLIRLAFDVVKRNFTMTEEDERDWDLMVRYFITCPILLPNRKMLFGKRHGVPSGSMFTQLIDSIVNCIAVEYALETTKTLSTRYYVLGDDSLIGVRGPKPSLGKLADAVAELGIAVNLTKSRVHRGQPYFLGHFWNWFFGTREMVETWEKVLTPEKIDPRLFRRGEEGESSKVEYYVERLRAFQDDNPAAFGVLQMVIDKLLNRATSEALDLYGFAKTNAAFDERATWDLAVRFIYKERKKVRAFNRHLYQMSSVVGV